MHNILLIARREYKERVKTKGFMIATILIPTLMGGGITLAAKLASGSKTASHIAVVAQTPQPAADLKQELEHGKDSDMKVDLVDPATTTATLDKQIKNKALDGYLVIHTAGYSRRAALCSTSHHAPVPTSLPAAP